MIRQILVDYNSLPDYRTMDLHEIIFFYEPLIESLKTKGED